MTKRLRILLTVLAAALTFLAGPARAGSEQPHQPNPIDFRGQNGDGSDCPTPTRVPEPTPLALLGMGLAGIALARRRIPIR